MKDSGGTYVRTQKLIELLGVAWKNRIPPGSEEQRSQYDYYIKCLNAASQVLYTTVPDFDWRIRLSIASLIEILRLSLNTVFLNLGTAQDFRATRVIKAKFPNDETKTHMYRAGWCPSEIEAVAGRFMCLQSLVFLSRTKRQYPYRDHQQCTVNRCKSYQTDSSSYTPKHRESHCQCDDASFFNIENAVRNILEKNNGGIPLLKISGEGSTVQLEVFESNANTKYTAISHVWADGLGNPTKNSLPERQLAYLGALTKALHRKALLKEARASSNNSQQIQERVSLGGYSEILLWIDTLCCPSTPSKAKDRAIIRLRETYTKAEYVLALDSRLQLISLRETRPVETLLRVFSCGWTFRLWTLQEAILAKRLWFQFKDQAEELSVLKMELLTAPGLDVRLLGITHDLMSQFSWIEINPSDQTYDRTLRKKKAVGDALSTLDTALQHRSVTVETDEALCISTLLGLPLEDLISVSNTVEDRMSNVWRLIAEHYGGILQGILKLRYPRLETPGFRWAPKTLLNEGTQYRGKARTLCWRDPMLGRLEVDGLHVQYPGVIVKRKQIDGHLFTDPWASLRSTKRSMNDIWHRVTFTDECSGARHGLMIREAYRTANSSGSDHQLLEDILNTETCAIILFWSRRETTGGEGMLGQVMATKGDTPVVRNLLPLLTLRITLDATMVYDTAEKLATVFRRSKTTEAIDRLQREGKVESQECKDLEDALRKSVLAKAKHQLENQELAALMDRTYPSRDKIKVLVDLVLSWYSQDYVGQNLGRDQQWCID